MASGPSRQELRGAGGEDWASRLLPRAASTLAHAAFHPGPFGCLVLGLRAIGLGHALACGPDAFHRATGGPQRIEYLRWDVRGLIGAKACIGWGRSFAEMVDTVQMREIHTVAAP